MSKEPGMFGSIFRKLRRFGSVLREKPQVVVDENELEHLLLYHGLAGTSPLDQPQFKDVRADIFDAILKKSSVEMAIALKLAPLWWEDKLASIFAEAHQYREEVISCLIPETDPLQTVPEADPLRHPDWRVRANAARILATLGVEKAVPPLVRNLDEDAENVSASFCHTAYSLAKLQTPQARLALSKHLDHEDPWFRVDVIGALAKWPLTDVASDLMNAMQRTHAMTDYASVALTRDYKASQLLRLPGEYREGALEVVLGLVQAAEGTFSSDTAIVEDIEDCLDEVSALANEDPTPRRLRALIELCDFLDRRSESASVRTRAMNAKQHFAKPEYTEKLLAWLAAPENQSIGEFRHAVKLAAHYNIASAESHILKHLKADSPYVNESIEALGVMSNPEAAPHLVRLLEQLIDVDERTSRSMSKQPVSEDDPLKAKTYWQGLRALGSLPHEDSVRYLLKATNDFAADKRREAIASLVELAQNEGIRNQYGTEIVSTVQTALTDASPPVRVTALDGIDRLQLVDLIPAAVKLTAAKETAVWKQAAETLTQLAEAGYAPQVSAALQASIQSERDEYRRQRLTGILNGVSQNKAK